MQTSNFNMRDVPDFVQGIIRRFTDTIDPDLVDGLTSDVVAQSPSETQHKTGDQNTSQLQLLPRTPSSAYSQVSKLNENELIAINDLHTALEMYHEQNIEPKLDLDPKKCSWEDVLNCMKQAETQYHDKAQGILGKLRSSWRKAGDAEEYVEPLLSIIPDSMGISVLKAGISIVFLVSQWPSKNDFASTL